MYRLALALYPLLAACQWLSRKLRGRRAVLPSASLNMRRKS